MTGNELVTKTWTDRRGIMYAKTITGSIVRISEKKSKAQKKKQNKQNIRRGRM